MPSIHSYVVRYDSGFAPNPFYGWCTLATCKPAIRKHAAIGDWIVGSGSADRTVKLGGHLVHAMRVTDTLTFDDYNADPRFEKKKPYRYGSRKQSCGDNIYFRETLDSPWQQRDSFHSRVDGTLSAEHVDRDTGVNRVLVSDHYVYFGGEGPVIPNDLVDESGRSLAKHGIGQSRFDDANLVDRLDDWVKSLGGMGLQGMPHEWLTLRGRP